MAELLTGLVPALGQALLHFLWQGALLGVFATLALRALRHARPQVRYAVACGALLACALLPLATLLAQLAATAPAASFEDSMLVDPRAPLPGMPAALRLASFPAHFDAMLSWIVVLWAAGTGVMSLRLLLGLAWIQRLCRGPHDAAHAAWQARLDALALRFGLKAAIALRLVEGIDSPLSAGWWRPVVLLPTALLARMPVELIEALIAHELAHIRRHDYLVNLLQSVVEAVLFYHPVTWWLSRRIRIEREQIADQLATEVIGAPRTLARALAELAEVRRVQPTLHLAQAAHGGQLLARIEALVRPTRSAQSGARIVLPLLALAMTCVASYAYAQIGRPHPDTAVAHAAPLQPAREAAIRQTFALLGKAGTPVIFDGPDDDLTAEVIAQHGVSRDALWVRRNRQDYVVTAPELVARAHRPWRDAEALDRQVDAFDRELEALDAQSLALDARLQQASAQPASAATDALLRQAADIEAQRRPLIERLQVLRPAQGTAYTRAVQETHALITEALSQGRAKRIPAPTTAQ